MNPEMQLSMQLGPSSPCPVEFAAGCHIPDYSGLGSDVIALQGGEYCGALSGHLWLATVTESTVTWALRSSQTGGQQVQRSRHKLLSWGPGTLLALPAVELPVVDLPTPWSTREMSTMGFHLQADGEHHSQHITQILLQV